MSTRNMACPEVHPSSSLMGTTLMESRHSFAAIATGTHETHRSRPATLDMAGLVYRCELILVLQAFGNITAKAWVRVFCASVPSRNYIRERSGRQCQSLPKLGPK